MAATAKQAINIIICGKTANVANGVTAVMQPQVRVVHTCFDLESALRDVPAWLSRPSSDDQRPSAIMLGGAFDDAAFAQIHTSARAAGQQTTWLRHNHALEASVKPKESQDGYGREVGKRAKEILLQMQRNGELDKSIDREVLY